MGPRRPAVRSGNRRQASLRPSRLDQAHPRGGRAGPHRRYAHA